MLHNERTIVGNIPKARCVSYAPTFRRMLSTLLRKLSKVNCETEVKCSAIAAMLRPLGVGTVRQLIQAYFEADSNGTRDALHLFYVVSGVTPEDIMNEDNVDCPITGGHPYRKLRSGYGGHHMVLMEAISALAAAVELLSGKMALESAGEMVAQGDSLNPYMVIEINKSTAEERSRLMEIYFKQRDTASLADITDRILWLRNISLSETDKKFAQELMLVGLRSWPLFLLNYYVPELVTDDIKPLVSHAVCGYSSHDRIDDVTNQLRFSDELIYPLEVRIRAATSVQKELSA